MIAERDRGKVFSALLKSAAVFVLDFAINITWSFIALAIFLGFFSNLQDNSFGMEQLLGKTAESPEFLFLSSIYNIFAVIMVYLFWRYVDREAADNMGLKWKHTSLSQIALGILGGTFEIAIIIFISLAAGTLWYKGSGPEFYTWPELFSSLSLGFLTFVLVGFGEEAVFRGYIQKRLMLVLGNRWALLLSSLIFMAAHSLTYGKPLDFIDVGLGGVIMGYLYILSGSLYMPAAYHFMYDYLQVSIVRLQDYEYFTGAVLYMFNNSGDVIISGINYGNVIEISFILAELIMLAMLYAFRKQIRKICGSKPCEATVE